MTSKPERTFALLREQPPADRGGSASNATMVPLLMRDLSKPWQVTDGPLSSRLEFSRAVFGEEALSRWSGRTQAFAWPSLARVGREADRLSKEPAAKIVASR